MAEEEKESSTKQGVLGWIKTFFQQQSRTIWDGLSANIPKILQSIANNKYGLFTREQDEAIIHIGSDLVKQKLLSENDIKVMHEQSKAFGVMGWLVYALQIMGIWMKYMGGKTDMYLADTWQNLASQLSPALPGPGEVMPAAFIAPEKTGEVRDILKKNGFKDKDIDLMFLSMYKLYDPNTVRELFLRGKIDNNKVFERMREMGFTDTRIKEMSSVWYEIPPIPDLIRMAVREAFSPDIAKRFGQYEDFPGDVLPHAAAQGLDKEWVERYWAAHWDLPSPQMGFEMFQRGIIEIADLKMLLRALDVMPFWRDKMIQIAYTPFTRVDIRRMHKLGVLKDEDLPRVHQDIGYSPEKAEMLSRFVMELNRADKVNLSKASILKAFRLRSISEYECRDMLVASGVRAGEADWYIAQEKLNLDIEIQQEILDNIGLRYTNNLMSKGDAVVKLNKLTLPSEQINALLDRWEIKKYLDMKVPSRADLGKMYIAKTITKDKYQLGMNRLGYGAADIYSYLEYMDKIKKAI